MAGSPITCPWPLGQFVGPPCSCLVPAFNAQFADVTIFMARVLEGAGIDRHSVDGPTTGTGIFTAIAASHARFGALWSHKERVAPFGPPRKSFRSLPLFKETHYLSIYYAGGQSTLLREKGI